MTESQKAICPSCESLLIQKIGDIPASDVFAGKVLHKALAGGGLFTCLSCGCAFRFPVFHKDTLGEMYQRGKEKCWSSEPEEGLQRYDWAQAYTWIQQVETTHKHLLDIGCSRGDFLKGLEREIIRYGVEIHQGAAAYAQQCGIKILSDDFESLKAQGMLFDVVTAFDVIEHSFNPKKFLRQAAEITRTGGEVMISTGNSSAASWRIMGSRYWYCTIPEHLSFINPVWCNGVAGECNLKVLEFAYFSHVGQTNLFKQFKDCMLNIVYKLSPSLFHVMRKWGLGGKNARKFPELLDFPPSWMSAKDHFIVRFRKL